MADNKPRVTTRASVTQSSPEPIVIPNGNQKVKIVTIKRSKK